MYEHVCSLPLAADAFCLAVHPQQSVFAVGLASGHVEAFQLPCSGDVETGGDKNGLEAGNGATTDTAGTQRRRSSSITSTTGPINTVSSIWRTRRHKGSCRALAFSPDGSTLFSAGIDGIVKAADAATGRVVGKVAVPPSKTAAESTPSTMLVLNPQALVMGTDGGAVHIYKLTAISSAESEITTLVPEPKPSQTLYPHRTDTDPGNVEAIASLESLPPSSASTSQASRSFVSVAGSTLAVTDIHKGVVACSIDQGDMLLSASCVPLAPSANSNQKKRKAGGQKQEEVNVSNQKVLVGSSDGLVTLWNRGDWDDQKTRTSVAGGGIIFGQDDDASVECLAVMPAEDGEASFSRTVAAGLGSGVIKLIEVRPGKGTGVARVVGEASHDERGVEGVVAVGFEVGEGRMVSAGGEIVKVWRPKGPDADDEGDQDSWQDTEGSDSDGEAAEDVAAESVETEGQDTPNGDAELDEDDEQEDSSSYEDDNRDKAPRKKRRKGKDQPIGAHGHHGVLAFSGLE